MPASLTVGAQLGVPASDPLRVHRLPARVHARHGCDDASGRHGALIPRNGSSTEHNPLPELARPVLSATGWRVRATLYRPLYGRDWAHQSLIER